MALCCSRRQAADGTPRVHWEWFCISNVIAISVFAGAVSQLASTWMAHGRHLTLAILLSTPLAALSAVAATACLLYFFAFFGVAFMHQDVDSLMPPAGSPLKGKADPAAAPAAVSPVSKSVDAAEPVASAAAAAAATPASGAGAGAGAAAAAADPKVAVCVPACATPAGVAAATRPSASMKQEYDADVVIVGAGTAGATLAAVLARDGKKVVLIERTYNMTDRIVGELMQPGGVRCLERMGMDAAVKGAATRGIPVVGYACVTPVRAGEACAASAASASASASSASASAGAATASGAAAEPDLILTYPAADPSSLKEYFGVLPTDGRAVTRHEGHGAAAAGGSGKSASGAAAHVGGIDWTDGAPRGISFHNHLFVHQLRKLAAAEPNVSMHIGSARRMVSGADLKTGGLDMQSRRTTFAPAPVFGGFNAAEESVGQVPPPAGSPAPPAAPATLLPLPAGADDETVMGVEWVDEAGGRHVTTARLTVACDGMYGVLRKAVAAGTAKVVSHFCGLIMHHPAYQPPVPYPNRGHVVMADPNPVLLYQISPTETRVLVDVPNSYMEPCEGEKDFMPALKRHFRDVVAPQLPAVSRPAFLAALETQEPHCMGNRHLAAEKVTRAGAVLLGDALNMRHPLTGGGMTVALKDAEMLWRALRGRDLQSAGAGELTAAIDAFQTQRGNHASTINILANALYRVFTRPASDASGTRGRLRAACIEYLSMGGPFTAGPLGLLSGLTPRPGVLVTHFFAVALYAMKSSLLPLPTPARLRQGYDLIHVACMIIMPLLEMEKVTAMSSAPVLWLTNALFPWRHVDLLSL